MFLIFSAGGTMAFSSRSRYLTDSERATIVSSEECLVDSDDGSDDEEEDAYNVSDQDVDSDADRACVSTDTYVWQDMINYIAWKRMHA
jgi:hypothetical protein